MSQLTDVRDHLEADSNVTIVADQTETFLPDPDGFWTQMVNIFVAHSDGIYTVAELQAFMLSLIPTGLSVSKQVNFHSWAPSRMMFGQLCFDEPVGHFTGRIVTTESLVVTDPDVKLPASFDGDPRFTFESVVDKDEDLRRQIWVGVYPDRRYAQRAAEGDDPYVTDALFDPSIKAPRRQLSGRRPSWLRSSKG